MEIQTDLEEKTLKLIVRTDADRDELIRVLHLMNTSKKWYQFWKKTPTLTTFSGKHLASVEISF